MLSTEFRFSEYIKNADYLKKGGYYCSIFLTPIILFWNLDFLQDLDFFLFSN